MKRKIFWILVSCLMALSLVLASCGTTEPEEEEEEEVVEEEEEEEEVVEEEEEEEPVVTGPQYGGTLTVCVGTPFTSPNPTQGNPALATFNSYSYERMGLADWTLGPAGTGEYNFAPGGYFYPFVGAIAESWEQTDPYTYIFHIREGVYFSDKTPVNGRECVAEDVVYSINHLLEHPEVNTFVDPRIMVSITATDKYTVELKVNAIDYRIPQIYMIGTGVQILPQEMEDTYGLGYAGVEGVCGTGPFVLTDFVAGSSATFESNDSYWGYDEFNPENQLPYVDTLKYLMIADTSTSLSALRTGKIDRMGAISINDAESLKETSPELEYLSALSTTTVKVSMRQDLEDLPYSDIRVRKAMSMAIDREAILEDYLHGQGEILTYLVMEPYNPDVYTPLEELPEETREQFEYDPERAKELLADAGYPDGFQAQCITAQTSLEELQILVAYWKAIGIDCEIKTVDFGTWITQSWAKQFPHMTYGGTGTFNPAYTMEERTSTAYFNYDSHYNEEYDAGVAEMIQMQDEAERNEKIKELNLTFLSTVPCIQFPGANSYSFWWPWVKNYHGESSLGFQEDGGLFARVWIDQELKKEMGY